MSARRYGQEQAAKVQPPDRPLNPGGPMTDGYQEVIGTFKPGPRPSVPPPPPPLTVGSRTDPHTAALDNLAAAIRELAAAIRTGLEVPDAQG